MISNMIPKRLMFCTASLATAREHSTKTLPLLGLDTKD